MTKLLQRLLAMVLFCVALQVNASARERDPRPYKLFANGRQLTIKSEKSIRQVMLWTVNGNRVAEHKDVNKSSLMVEIPVNHKVFYLMITLTNGEVYTQKVGIP